MRVPSRKRSQNPPKGKRNIIDSKEPDGKGICIRSPFQVHTLKLTPSSPTDSGGFLNHVRMRCGEGGFLSGRWWPPITWVFWVEKIVLPKDHFVGTFTVRSFLLFLAKQAFDWKKMEVFPKMRGKKKQTWKTTWREWKLVKMNFKKKRPPISWVQSFWGKKTSVYIGYRLGYRSARHISYNTLSKGPLSNLRLSMKSKVLFCVVRYANR